MHLGWFGWLCGLVGVVSLYWGMLSCCVVLILQGIGVTATDGVWRLVLGPAWGLDARPSRPQRLDILGMFQLVTNVKRWFFGDARLATADESWGDEPADLTAIEDAQHASTREVNDCQM